MNIAVVIGTVDGSVRTSELRDGTLALSFDVRPSESSESVPCSWIGAVADRPEVPDGSPVTVIGRLRRHFYRRGGATTSRTDLLAERVILGPPSRSRRARARAASQLE